ncbi:MAG: hypothetical protein Q8M06_08520 [Methanobacteriaceae archaeon]|nr:hypothetical protein [Methanobacteriaceae archaeon]
MTDDPSLRKGLVKVLFVCSIFILTVFGSFILNPDNDVNAATISGNFKPSIGGSGYSYKWYYKSWENYCPGCKRHNTLKMNPKKVPEKELTCGKCDSDYCGVTGSEKSYKRRWKLTAAGQNIIKSSDTINKTTSVSKSTPKYILKRKNSYKWIRGWKVKTVRYYKVYNNGKVWKKYNTKKFYWSKRYKKWRSY